MEWELWGKEKKQVKESFRQVKKDILGLHNRFSCIEEELKRLQDQITQLQEDKKSFEENRNISASQNIPSVPDLRLMIEEIIGKALEKHNTKAAEPVPAGTQAETVPELEIEPEPEPTVIAPTPQAEPIIKQAPIQQSQDRLKEDLIRTYERNRKNIVKQQILAELRKGGTTKIELRDIVVDQKKYCSRSAFYRYLDELEMEGSVGFERQRGKDILISVMQ